MPLTRAVLKRRQEEGTPSNVDEDSPCSSSRDEGKIKKRRPLLEPRNNPLLNDLILSNLFEFMGPNDLKTCRLVCKKWNILTIPTVRSQLKVRIYGHRTDPVIGDYCSIEANRTIEGFMEVIRSNTLGIQFQNFVLGPINPTVGVGEEFISRFGKDIRSLDLQVSKGVHKVEHISAIIQSTPNLEHFGMPRKMCSNQGSETVVKLHPPKLAFLKTFYTRMEDPAGRRKNCPTFLEEFFTASENISTVYLNDYDRPVRVPGVTLEVLQVLENLGRVSTLENLIVSCVSSANLITLKRMASNGLKLKHLRILQGQTAIRRNLQDPQPEPAWLQLLQLFAETLITLGVCYGGIGLTELPRLPQVKTLDIQIPKHGDLRCERINFTDTFPALENLSLVRKGGHYGHNFGSNGPLDLHGFFSGNDICPNMKTLSLREGFDLTTNQALERALKIFPNLNELELNIESIKFLKLLQHIWVHVPSLEKLHLYGKLKNKKIDNINLDSLFTGIPPQELKKIDCESHFRTLQRMSPEDRRQTLHDLVKRHRTLPSISNLTRLRFLSLSLPEGYRFGPWISKFMMTDLTGYLGLYFLKNLQELRLWNCVFSRTCIKVLIQDRGLLSWNFKQGEWEDVKDRVRSHKKPYHGIRRKELLEFDYMLEFGD